MITPLVLHAQNNELPDKAVFGESSTLVWLGTYSTIRIGENLYWEAQHHFRTSSYENTPWVGRLAQIYNRHALTYRFSNNFLFTVGPVLRLNFSPQPGNDNFKKLTLEPRIWHQYAFPFTTHIGNRQLVYQHRLRFEHRWSKNNIIGADWVYRNRYRYRFSVKIPISRKTLQPNTWYITPINWEIIMQSGRSVINAPMEDMRIYPSIGYIASSQIAYSAGMMYTTGQRLGAGHEYSQRWVLRVNVWWSPDSRKFENKIPEIKFRD